MHPTTFTNNCEQLTEAEAARVLLKEVVKEARRGRMLSADHFTVDGTLLDAWATHESYRPHEERPPKDRRRNRTRDLKGDHRHGETHGSTSDPEARLCYRGHVLSENRHGLVVDVEPIEAGGYAEREAALAMLERSVTGPAQRDRSSYDSAPGLPPQSAPAQAGRGDVRLDQDGRHRCQAALPGPGPRQVVARTACRRLQPHPSRQPRGGRRVIVRCRRGLRRLHQARG